MSKREGGEGGVRVVGERRREVKKLKEEVEVEIERGVMKIVEEGKEEKGMGLEKRTGTGGEVSQRGHAAAACY
jgi:hypothetical protein